MDFIGRLDVGTGFGVAKLVVIGQAKCQSPTAATSGNDVARTAARLIRGRIGVYVTTGYFANQVQQEMIEDKCPVVLIHGKRVAEELLRAVHDGGYVSLGALLDDIDGQYDGMVQARKPEEILLE